MIWHALREITYVAVIGVALYFCIGMLAELHVLVR